MIAPPAEKRGAASIGADLIKHRKNLNQMKWNMIRSRWILVVAALFCGLSPVSALGQTFRGSISGTVADKTGAMIPGADVKIEQRETGFKRNMATTGAGVFSFSDLPVGFYNITCAWTAVEIAFFCVKTNLFF